MSRIVASFAGGSRHLRVGLHKDVDSTEMELRILAVFDPFEVDVGLLLAMEGIFVDYHRRCDRDDWKPLSSGRLCLNLCRQARSKQTIESRVGSCCCWYRDKRRWKESKVASAIATG